jgi:hypothetical protein
VIARLRALPRLELAAIALAILVLVILSVATQDARTPAPAASYSTYDADSGGTKAFYELLADEGLDVDRFERLAVFLDRSISTLVWIEPLDFDERQRTPSAAEIKALDAWVRGGGRFIYVGHDAVAARTHVLKIPLAEARKRKTAGRGASFVDPLLRDAGVRSIEAGPGLRWKTYAGRVLVRDAYGPLVVRYAYGRGNVTAVVDEDLFSNAGIGTGDRARLAYALVRDPAPRAQIAFEETTHGYFVPEHWWQIAPRPLVVAVSIALVALAIAGIGAAVRLGPPLLPAVRDDATTADFIGALAGLLAAGRAQRSALVTAADSTTRALARSFGLPDGASAQDVASRIDRDDLRRDYATMLAVATNGFPDDRNLVRGVALAQVLRKEYAAHVDRRR